jgi:ubiquinone/menaquinone biosynthesis C-methylase UbiE
MSTVQGGEGGSIQAARLFWDSASEDYEEVFSGTSLGKIRREAVWRDMLRLFRRDDRVLEINCGTGLDAVFLAQHGVELVACDISPQMIERARQHAASESVGERIEFVVLPTEELGALADGPLFDGAFSNFSGLNCVKDLSPVRVQLSRRMKPGAPLLLCMMGSVGLWERFRFLLHGQFRRAFPRRQEKTAEFVRAPELKTYRYSVAEICAQFAPSFRLRRWKGIGITVPSAYMEHWARRLPRVVRFLAAVDQRIGGLPVFRDLADCVILEFEHVAKS